MAATIVRTQSVLGGKPRIRGTRIYVSTIVSYFLNGFNAMTFDEIIPD